MEMSEEWAKLLAINGIKWEDKGDVIIFYDPIEGTIREHIKSQTGDYYSRRIGVYTHNDSDKK